MQNLKAIYFINTNLMNEKNKTGVTQVPFEKMRKVSTVIDPNTGVVISKTEFNPGENKFDKLKEQRRIRLGI